MAKKNRHNAAFVVGSVVGAVAGAAVALWKTPYTGEELRSKLGGSSTQGGAETRTYGAPASTAAPAGQERSFKDKVLSGVEKTLAPIVGVELGKTAKGGGTTATPMDSGDIKVTMGHGSATQPASAGTAGTGDEHFGLSRDKVDPEKWAAAYGTAAEGTSTASSEPVRGTTSQESDSSRLRPTRSWDTGESAATGERSEKLGLSRDKVDAEKWAAAYGTGASAPDTQATQANQPATGTTSSTVVSGTGSQDTGLTRESVESGQERLTGARSRVDADRWSQDYGTSDTQYASQAAESEAQTGLGAKPAYPGNDQTGHEPANPTAPDDSIADVSHNADDAGIRDRDSNLTVEDAASVEDLSTPQVDRVPDALQERDGSSYHPFPKLGGKER